ncbi:MAG: FHA domain-containing protein, partial [Planctomycetota bacterium]
MNSEKRGKLISMASKVVAPYFFTNEVTIGRKDCTISLEDPSVLAKHLKISINDQGKFCFECFGKGVIYLNGKEARKGILQNGDYLRIGETVFRFYYDGDEKSSSPLSSSVSKETKNREGYSKEKERKKSGRSP